MANLLLDKNKYFCVFVSIIVIILASIIFTRLRINLENVETTKVAIRDSVVCVLIVFCGFIWMFCNFYSLKPAEEKRVINVNRICGRVTYVERKNDHAIFDVNTTIYGKKTKVRCKKYFRKCISPENKISYGKNIVAVGKLYIPSAARNPGCFDYAAYLKTKKIKYLMRVDRVNLDPDPNEHNRFFQNNLWESRRAIYGRKELYLKQIAGKRETVYGFIKGVTFGDANDLEQNTLKEFRENTTAHVLAVSGLHVGVIFGMLKVMTLGRYSYLIAFFTTLSMCFYGELTLWNVATTRALIIVIIAIFSFYLKKPFDLTTAISVAFIIMLTYNPYLLFGASFQMSFLAVFGISIFTENLGRIFGNNIGFILALQLSMAPYTAFLFNKFNPIGFLINIPIVFMVSILVPISIFALIWQLLLGNIPLVIVKSIRYISFLIIKLNRVLYNGGKFSRLTSSSDIRIILITYGLLFFVFSEFALVLMLRREFNKIAICIGVIILCITSVAYGYKNDFLDDEIVFIDVGQGDAIHIRNGDINILIDGGGDKERNVGETILKEYFLKNGISTINASIFTHMHMDHAKGAIELGAVFPVKKYYVPYAYSDTVTGNEFCTVKHGDKIFISNNIWIEAIWPIKKEKIKENEDKNENNTVYMVNYTGKRILITGDLVLDDEQDMIKYYKNTNKLRCDVLKVAHHGSKYSTSNEFLDIVEPKLAIVQVGKNNMYGHPTKETLKRLKMHGIKIYRNDLNGAVGLDIKGDKIKIDRMI